MGLAEEKTKLLKEAGQDLCEKLLDPRLKIRICSHSTGCQIDILTTEPQLEVWKGSIWYSCRYDFNDRGKTGGLQPDFEFLSPTILDFFEQVQLSVDERKERLSQRDAFDNSEKEKTRVRNIEEVKKSFCA